MDDIERTTIRKIMKRLVPFLCLCYFIAYLDRVNVGFAALQMNAALGLDAGMFGFGAGLFFIAYFLLEVPSNMALDRFGARRWIARIMITWGLFSGATAFCTGPWSYASVRFLLGVAEAGLYPGVLLFFTYWFPDWHRARIVSGFMIALPLAVAAGSPLSTSLLELNGVFGIAGWKWMFIAEAIPTIIVGIVFLFYVTDRPHLANWLSADEREQAEALLAITDSLFADLRRLFATNGRCYIYIANGHGAWEAALTNVLSRGDKVLVLESGRFALSWGEAAAKLGADMEILHGDWRRAVDPAAVEARLRADTSGSIKAAC